MAAPMAHGMMNRTAAGFGHKFLFYFANEHVDFKLPELTSISSLLGLDMKFDEAKYEKKNPYLVVNLPSVNDAKKIMTRTVLARSLFELWGQGSTWKELFDSLRKYPSELSKQYLAEDSTFKIEVESFNKRLLHKEKISRIESIPQDVVTFKGRVSLKNPDHVFGLLEYYGPEGTTPSDQPQLLYFGRWIASGQRERIQEYHLQNRHFIGNTSMDAGLSLIMANMAQVKKNSFVMDPFVGTGSLLVACAHFGGYVMGTELDYLLLHAKAKPSRHNQKKRAPDESIRANLNQYGFESAYIDAIVADASKHDMWRHHGIFDAIITDPPYGIREPAKKIANVKVEITEVEKQSHIPQRVQYELSDIFKDLLNLSAKFLRLNGRLVFWFPVIRPDYSDSNVPRHPCFKLVANSEQPLSMRVGRRLITMEKVREYQDIKDETGASYDVDHFGESSFRDRYFKNPRDISPKRSPRLSPRSRKTKCSRNNDLEHCVEQLKITNNDEQSDQDETACAVQTRSGS